MSTIAKAVLPVHKVLSKNLFSELLVLQNKAHDVHTAKDVEKQKTLLKYKKMNLLKQSGDVSQLDFKLAQLDKKVEGEAPVALKSEALYKVLIGEEEKANVYKLNHIRNITDFLKSQRVYTELLERYNPGLTMRQDDNVRRSANRVGLSLPE